MEVETPRPVPASAQTSPQPGPAQSQPPQVPPEFLKKLAEAEDLVTKLQQQNQTQREELENIQQSLEKEARMKYRGCNHPTRSTRLRQRNNSQDSQYVSGSRLDLRASDRFPPLRSLLVPRSRRARSDGQMKAVFLLRIGTQEVSDHGTPSQ